MASLTTIKPSYKPTPIPPTNTTHESPQVQSLIKTLSLLPHPEGGYFVETDRNPLRITNPYADGRVNSLNKDNPDSYKEGLNLQPGDLTDAERSRSASTSIFYLLTPLSPLGVFHRNASRTVHTLHRGRGKYVIIHADEAARKGGDGKARVESFVVGQNVEKGEKLQWIVEGGEYKATFLLPDDEGVEPGDERGGSGGLLISETVVPGFEFADHDFLKPEGLEKLLTPDQVKELNWLLRNHYASD